MSIWNPYAFTPTGKPVGPVSPPALRVLGDQATAAQLAMAQHAFAQFCMQVRLSAVQNPTEAGRLPDGTPYKIIDVAGVRTMTLWPSNGDEDRRSGVVIALGNLDGEVIDGHHTDGIPTRYLLTPKAKANRAATGEWKVRKLREPWDGGKAVQSTPNGKKYFAGIEGRSDFLYPYNNGRFGSLNEQAYTVEDREVLSVRQGGVEVFLSNDTESPIPFILQQDGKEYAAQLVFGVGGGVTTASLYVGPLKKTPGVPVGELVDTITFPSSVAIKQYTVSVRNDGREARTTARDGTEICNLTFHISKDSLSYTLTDRTSDYSTQYEYATVVNIDNLVWNSAGGYTRSRRSNYNYVDTDGITKGLTGKTTEKTGITKVFAFGPKGQEVLASTAGNSFITEGTANYEFYEEDSKLGTKGWEQTDSYQKITVLNNCPEVSEFVGSSSEAAIYREKTVTIRGEWNYAPPVWDGLLIERGLEYYGTVSSIFYDRYQQFAIYLDIVPPSYIGIARASGSSKAFYPESHTVSPGKVLLKVKHKTSILMNQQLVITSDQPGTFISYAASDPLTAALVVNLIRVKRMPSGANKRLASWIFIVDESGVKTLQDLMPSLPQDVCAIENRLLYSL